MKGGGKVVTAEVKVEVEDGPIASALETVARCGGLRPHQVLVRNKSEPAEVKVPKTMLFGADVEVRGRRDGKGKGGREEEKKRRREEEGKKRGEETKRISPLL